MGKFFCIRSPKEYKAGEREEWERDPLHSHSSEYPTLESVGDDRADDQSVDNDAFEIAWDEILGSLVSDTNLEAAAAVFIPSDPDAQVRNLRAKVIEKAAFNGAHLVVSLAHFGFLSKHVFVAASKMPQQG